MKYLIDHRYKTIHSIKVTIASILAICERGRSKDLNSKLDLLLKYLPELKTMMAPPFGEKMIGFLKKLNSDIDEFSDVAAIRGFSGIVQINTISVAYCSEGTPGTAPVGNSFTISI